jgi:hypothetical protein
VTHLTSQERIMTTTKLFGSVFLSSTLCLGAAAAQSDSAPRPQTTMGLEFEDAYGPLAGASDMVLQLDRDAAQRRLSIRAHLPGDVDGFVAILISDKAPNHAFGDVVFLSGATILASGATRVGSFGLEVNPDEIPPDADLFVQAVGIDQAGRLAVSKVMPLDLDDSDAHQGRVGTQPLDPPPADTSR